MTTDIPRLTDDEHSLDALLEPLGVLRERGLGWRIDSLAEQGTTVTGGYQAEIGRWAKGNKTPWKTVALSDIEDTPSEALALAVAAAMEANR